MAWGIGPGDAVFVPAFTFAASAEVVALAGASPVFVDVLEDTYNMDPASLEAAIALVKREGKLHARAVMPVDLFGQPADYRAHRAHRQARRPEDAVRHRPGLRRDAIDGRGDGQHRRCGVDQLLPGQAARLLWRRRGLLHQRRRRWPICSSRVRNHGQGADRYENVRIGMNSRLDTIQAAILIEKLKIFPEEIELREAVARRYNEALGKSNRIRVPVVIAGAQSTWAQYTIQVPDRDKLQADLKAKGIPTAVYYPIPLSAQKGYAHYPSAPMPGQRENLQDGRRPADASLSGRGDAGQHHRGGSGERRLNSSENNDFNEWVGAVSWQEGRRAGACARPLAEPSCAAPYRSFGGQQRMVSTRRPW